MRRIREVLRLRAELGPNLSAISAGANLARSTVRAYLDRAAAAGLDAAAAEGLSETALEAAFFPAAIRRPRACSEWQKASGRGLSMRQVHHAGETVQVDYAGDTIAPMDGGTARAAQIFVACLLCSGLIYAEASWTQASDDWLAAHVRLFAFLGGVPAKVVPDNLKVGVTHASLLRPGDQRHLCRADQALRHGRGSGAGAQAAR